jgi:16S rRNA (cytosine1402-N4)-methyltransferase
MDYHLPVLLHESIALLAPDSQKVFLDATLGHGGHTLALLENGAKVYGLDQDPQNLKIASTRINQAGFASSFTPIHGNFSNISSIWRQFNYPQVNGIIFDLGLSQNQITAQKRGFSFQDTQSLDMRLDPDQSDLTAEYITNTYSHQQLFDIFTKFAQEKYATPLILRLIRRRQKSPFKSAAEIAQVIKDYYQEHHLQSHLHPATKILMALRIVVNNEFVHLREGLLQTFDITHPGSHVAIITFHSGEDRIVKNFIRQAASQNKIDNLTPKAIAPQFDEVKRNPLSRSALLRVYRIK